MTRLKNTVLYLVSVHLIALTMFFFFRLILFLVNENYYDGETFGQILPAFVYGFRFDTVTSSIFLSIPAVILLISLFFKANKYVIRTVSVYVSIVYSICLLLACSDIPYFDYFFKHIDSSIWSYLQQPTFVIRMALESPVYLFYVVIFIVASIGLCKIFSILRKKFLEADYEGKISSKKDVLLFVCSLLILFPLFLAGMRGSFRIGHHAIRISDGYYCTNPLLNQLGMNATYSLLRTSMDKEENEEIQLIDERTAIEQVRANLHIDTDSLLYISPVARFVPQADTILRKNVVVILMESMASHFVADTTLTPFLNQLIKKSIYFSNAYSAGIHTRNGVFATLFSYPAILENIPFPRNNIAVYDSWPAVMKELGYKTLYFTTHGAEYDNIRAHITANKVETFVSEENYPPEEIRNVWGCSDDFLFRNAIPILSEAAREKNIFATLLTTSNHPPYALPEYFKPRSTDIDLQAVEYADYALQIFFEKAKNEPWYNNTIFVLLGDHGEIRGLQTKDYDVSLARHQIPIIIYDPQNEIAQRKEFLAEQCDVFPTVMGMLGYEYINNTMGIDLFRETHTMLCFTSDNAFCCLDSSDYYVCRKNGVESLYHFREHSQQDYFSENLQKSTLMKNYSCSMIQTAQAIIKMKQTKLK